MSAHESSIGAPSAEGLASATQRMLEEAQLSRVRTKLGELSNTRDMVRALGQDPDQYGQQLAKQYRDLALKLRQPVHPRPSNLPPRLTQSLDKLAIIFNFWQSVLVPNATVGLAQAPNSSDTSGSIGADIFQGQLALGGQLSNSGPQEQWWINTWQYMAPFPTTPTNFGSPASLSYRFNIGASLNFYRDDVVTGSVHVYTTVASTSDLSTQPIDFNHFDSSNFLITATLPQSDPPLLFGSAKISNTIALVPGRTPAIGIIIGVIISIAEGGVLILPGEFSNIDLAPPDATSPSDLGKIEFRRDPPFWVDAVAKMVGS
jgi:hypothetical protein